MYIPLVMKLLYVLRSNPGDKVNYISSLFGIQKWPSYLALLKCRASSCNATMLQLLVCIKLLFLSPTLLNYSVSFKYPPTHWFAIQNHWIAIQSFFIERSLPISCSLIKIEVFCLLKSTAVHSTAYVARSSFVLPFS